MTLAEEIKLDENGELFNDELRDRYIAMHNRSLEKQEAAMKSFITSAAILAMLVLGKNFTIPIVNINTQDIPAATEIAILFSSFSFLMFSITFSNAQLYGAACDVIIQKTAQRNFIDPDFVSAAYVHTELYLKMFRKNLNFFGPDFFAAGRAYVFFYASLAIVLTLSIISLLFCYLAIVVYALWISAIGFWVPLSISVAAVTLNIAGLLIIMNPAFKFTPTQTTQ